MYGLLLQPNSSGSKSITVTSSTAAPTSGTTLSTSNCRQAYWQGEGVGQILSGTAVYETNIIAADFAGEWEVRETLDLSTLNSSTRKVSSQGTYPGGFFGRWRLTVALTGTGSFIGHHNALTQ